MALVVGGHHRRFPWLLANSYTAWICVADSKNPDNGRNIFQYLPIHQIGHLQLLNHQTQGPVNSLSKVMSAEQPPSYWVGLATTCCHITPTNADGDMN